MKILLVHNHYGSGSPSGENEVFKQERRMLINYGHEVRVFERFSDEILTRGRRGMIEGALATPWNPFAARKMKQIVEDFRPDIVHAHNTFPLISPAVFKASAGAARVLTLHNYRLFCPSAIPMRNGTICTECLERKSVLSAIKYGCYRDSRLATLPIAASVAIHRLRGTWNKDIDSFIVLTEFQRDSMIAAGLPAELVEIKPNFFPGCPTVSPINTRALQVVYAGRLSHEKGVDLIIDAWINWGTDAPQLLIIGDGPLRSALEQRCKRAGLPQISFMGQVSSDIAFKTIANSRLLILPSRWFEGFPMVLREAFAFGTPSLVANIGPLPSLVSKGSGATFQSGNSKDLLAQLRRLWVDDVQLSQMSLAARTTFEEDYTETANYKSLMKIYERAKQRAQT